MAWLMRSHCTVSRVSWSLLLYLSLFPPSQNMPRRGNKMQTKNRAGLLLAQWATGNILVQLQLPEAMLDKNDVGWATASSMPRGWDTAQDSNLFSLVFARLFQSSLWIWEWKGFVTMIHNQETTYKKGYILLLKTPIFLQDKNTIDKLGP